VITNNVSDYMNLLVRIAHIICNHPLYYGKSEKVWTGFIWLRIGSSGGLLEHGDEPSG